MVISASRLIVCAVVETWTRLKLLGGTSARLGVGATEVSGHLKRARQVG